MVKKNVSIAYGKSVFIYGQILELLLYYTFFWSPRSKHSFAQNRVLKKNSQGLFCKFGNGLFCRIYLANGFYEHDILSQNLCTNSCSYMAVLWIVSIMSLKYFIILDFHWYNLIFINISTIMCFNLSKKNGEKWS